jgi:phage-related protein
MSEGTVVRRQHYVTFLDALKVVSGIEEWDFGRAREVEPPSPLEDFPEPRHKDVAYA